MVILLETAVGLGWELGVSRFLLEGEVMTDVRRPPSPSPRLGCSFPLPGVWVWDVAFCHRLLTVRAALKDRWHQQGGRR